MFISAREKRRPIGPDKFEKRAVRHKLTREGKPGRTQIPNMHIYAFYIIVKLKVQRENSPFFLSSFVFSPLLFKSTPNAQHHFKMNLHQLLMLRTGDIQLQADKTVANMLVKPSLA